MSMLRMRLFGLDPAEVETALAAQREKGKDELDALLERRARARERLELAKQRLSSLRDALREVEDEAWLRASVRAAREEQGESVATEGADPELSLAPASDGVLETAERCVIHVRSGITCVQELQAVNARVEGVTARLREWARELRGDDAP